MKPPTRRSLLVVLRTRLDDHRGAGERGAVAVLVSILMMPVIMGSAALAIDISNWYYQAQRLQAAADAAALAGSVYMPGRLVSNDDPAPKAALAIAKANGFDPATAGTSITWAKGTQASQLKVTITTTVKNAFGVAVGKPSQVLSRSAVGEYRGPVLMGSPCNVFANEPSNGNGEAKIATAPCTSTPDFWATIAGPGTDKQNGDQFSTTGCTRNSSGCTGSSSTYSRNTNTDYNPIGYFYKLSVKAPISSLTVQAFDPVFTNVGQQCTSTSLMNPWTKDKPNRFETVAGDAANRYSRGNTDFCTGDYDYGSGTGGSAQTTFAVRDPNASQDPTAAQLHPGCTRQFKGVAGSTSSTYLRDRLDKSYTSTYDDALAEGFRQWVTLCTITNPAVGDYYVQVRSDLPAGTTSQSALDARNGGGLTWNGANSYALRAKVAGAASSAVTLGGFGRIGVWANSDSTDSSFHLARISSASAGMSVDIQLFDAGDTNGAAGTISILPPTDARSAGSPLSLATRCTGQGEVVGSPSSPTSLTPCQLHPVSSSDGYQGQSQIIRVGLPADYTCNDASGDGCWFKIRMQFPGAVHDVTTWSTDLVGQPVRLVQ
ncbi:MAG: pilus assembly protein TadG-related protein [Candidatus Nanopelagicales bacterium]